MVAATIKVTENCNSASLVNLVQDSLVQKNLHAHRAHIYMYTANPTCGIRSDFALTTTPQNKGIT